MLKVFHFRCRLLGALMLATFGLPIETIAAAENSPGPTAPSMAWIKSISGRHEDFLKIAKAGDVDLLFIGDSITDFWRTKGKAVWAKNFAPLKAANFGIGGDGLGGVLWRLQNGELEGIRPKLVVLLIGTNNSREKAEAIASGIKDIILEIQTRSPGTRILLHGIFPRDGQPSAGSRSKFAQVNQILATSKLYLDVAIEGEPQGE